MTVTSVELSELDRSLLDFAGLTWRHVGVKEAAIRERFGISATRYHQLVLRLLDHPEALAYAPVTVNRLRRLQAQRAAARCGPRRHGDERRPSG